MRKPLPLVPELLNRIEQPQRKAEMEFEANSGLHVRASCGREYDYRQASYGYPQLYSTPQRLPEEVKFDWNSAIAEAKQSQEQR